MGSGAPVAGPSEGWLKDWRKRRARERYPGWEDKLPRGPRTNIWHWLHRGPFASCNCSDQNCRRWSYQVSQLEPGDPLTIVMPGEQTELDEDGWPVLVHPAERQKPPKGRPIGGDLL